MAKKPTQGIDYAKELFLKRDFLGSYALYRRYYDRLPFEVTSDHAGHIGYFSRLLLELGKEYELKFYFNSIESHYEKNPSLELAFQLASIRATGPEWVKDLAKSRALLEMIVRSTKDRNFLARAKMLLAYVFDCESEDLASCRKIIDSIEPTGNEELDTFSEIWKAKILRDEKKFEEAESKLKDLLTKISFETNWYGYFSILNMLAILYVRTQRIELALEIYDELKELLKGKKMCVTQRALNILEKELKKISSIGSIEVRKIEDEVEIQFGKTFYKFKKGSASELLLFHLLKEGSLDRDRIIRLLFDREYRSGADNKTVYYHIHHLRKFLAGLGVPSSALVLENKSYRFIPEVRFVES